MGDLLSKPKPVAEVIKENQRMIRKAVSAPHTSHVCFFLLYVVIHVACSVCLWLIWALIGCDVVYSLVQFFLDVACVLCACVLVRCCVLTSLLLLDTSTHTHIHLSRQIRDLEREISKMESEQKKLITNIKKAAKANQEATAKVMVKDLVRSKNYVNRFIMMKTQLNAVGLKIQTMKSHEAMSRYVYVCVFVYVRLCMCRCT